MPVNLHRVGYCGQSKSDDVRYKHSFIRNKQANLDIDPALRKIKKQAVDMKKVKLHLLKPWILGARLSYGKMSLTGNFQALF